MTTQAKDRLLEVLAGWNLSPSERQLNQLEAFDALLTDWNQRMDLTNITGPMEVVDRHYLDSLALLSVFPKAREAKRVLDLGSGGGLPGIPLAIFCPEARFVLLDAQLKRVRFLQEACERIVNNAVAVHDRGESFAHRPEEREQYDLVVSRAVAKLPVLIELMLPLLRVGGHAACYKGPGVSAELGDGGKAALLVGGALAGVLPVTLPARDFAHAVVLLEKVEKSAGKYPRKAGVPARKPLGMHGIPSVPIPGKKQTGD